MSIGNWDHSCISEEGLVVIIIIVVVVAAG